MGFRRCRLVRRAEQITSGVTKSVKEAKLSEANETDDKDFGSRHCSTLREMADAFFDNDRANPKRMGICRRSSGKLAK